MSAPSRIVCLQGDLTHESTDAIVNAANTSLRGGGGVDGAIHRAAGAGLLAECIERYPQGCPTGEARITSGHDLRARFVIHTPGPIYGEHDGAEAELLASCHRSSLEVGLLHDCRSFAFPAISCGVYGYPPGDAARIALRNCIDFMAREPRIERVRFVLFGDSMLRTWSRVLDELSI